MTALVGARIFDGERFLDDHVVMVEGARIVGVAPYAERPRGGGDIDLGGGLLTPGFVDVQVNGGGGALMNERPSVDVVARIAESHRKYGSVGVMPTLVTDTPDQMRTAIAAVREARRRFPSVLGIHLEGPFLDPARKGAHDASYIRPIEASDIEMIADADCGAVMLTVAPNCISVDAIRALAERGVLVSLGHSEASYETAQAGVAAGARAFTHLFNAMSPFQGRAPGMVGAALDAKEAFVGIIADGHHVHPASLRIAFAAKAPNRMMLISDAMPPAADGPDSFLLQGRRVARVDGCLRLGDGTIAGSVITMDEAVRFCVRTVGVTLADALTMASRTPAAFLRRDRDLGRIAAGYLASLVHLDDELRVREAWVEGEPTLAKAAA
jgi:N-acetylglucosamine-6-phosphate deacetylase